MDLRVVIGGSTAALGVDLTGTWTFAYQGTAGGPGGAGQPWYSATIAARLLMIYPDAGWGAWGCVDYQSGLMLGLHETLYGAYATRNIPGNFVVAATCNVLETIMTLATSQTGNIQTMVGLDGVNTNATLQPAGNTICKPTGSLPAGQNSSGNWTRTSATVATNVTFTAHGLAGTEKVALFWTGGYVYDCTVTVVDANTLTITVPNVSIAGVSTAQTALPAANTVMLLAVAQDVTNSVSIIGSDLQMLLVTSTQPGLCELIDGVPTQRRLSVLATANASDYWPTASGQSVPFTQTITTCRMYNNSLNAATMTVATLLA